MGGIKNSYGGSGNTTPSGGLFPNLGSTGNGGLVSTTFVPNPDRGDGLKDQTSGTFVPAGTSSTPPVTNNTTPPPKPTLMETIFGIYRTREGINQVSPYASLFGPTLAGNNQNTNQPGKATV